MRSTIKPPTHYGINSPLGGLDRQGMLFEPERTPKPTGADDNRIVAKSSERGEPPCDLDPIEELVRVVGEAHALSQRCWRSLARARVASARYGLGAGRESSPVFASMFSVQSPYGYAIAPTILPNYLILLARPTGIEPVFSP